MKNVFKFSLSVLFLLAGFNAEAAVDLDVKVMKEQILVVQLEKVEKGATILFQDSNGEILFRDSLQQDGSYEKKLDLGVVPNGVYYVLLEMESSILSAEITKTFRGIEITENSSNIIFKPFFKVKEKQVKVFLSNPNQKITVFNVYDAEGILVGFVKTKNPEVKKTLDFSQMPAGEYTVDVKVNGRTFSKKIIFG